ncbi:uncharacterized protein LOC126758196 [Bactrocera neohumeralis]|uniref:uncharacterized protein LOC126758196 n=1 Tax=Bactrocera neohumeralis TaxID=98809 RepID=UPI00216541C7|nr:uncharacterized protein LOC126758196 [Bactrocera neohumeralis]
MIASQKLYTIININEPLSLGNVNEFPDAVEGLQGIEAAMHNQTHWNAIREAIARQQNPRVAKIVGAADDIALAVIKRHLTDVASASNAEVVLIQDWLSSIGLQLGENKTDAVLKSRIKKVEQERIKQGNMLVEAKPQIGYLGLLLTTKLKFKHNLQYAEKLATLSNTNLLKKMLLGMTVSTAALLYPSTGPDNKLKLIVETNYAVERRLVSSKNSSTAQDEEAESDGVDVVSLDERKRWRMRRTESLPEVRELETVDI